MEDLWMLEQDEALTNLETEKSNLESDITIL